MKQSYCTFHTALRGLLFIPLAISLGFAQTGTPPEAGALKQAKALARRGQYEEAIKIYRKTAEQLNNQCRECLIGVAESYFALAKYKEAVNAWREVLALQTPDEATFLLRLSAALYWQGGEKNLNEALSLLQRAEDLQGNKVTALHYFRGMVLLKSKRETEGVIALQKFVELTAAGDDTDNARHYCQP